MSTVPNPDIKFAKSNGVDRPIMTCYLAGRICGEHIDKCLEWRKKLVNYYKNYKEKKVPIFGLNGTLDGYKTEYVAYPISFLCPLNSGEANSVDKKGLTSHLPPNLIYAKDILSVERADVIVANMEDFFEEDIKDILLIDEYNCFEKGFDYKKAFYRLHNKVLNRRENIGTIMEVAWALYLQKPVILIVPERRREIFEKHPFTRRASAIVSSVEELIEKKWLNSLYKSIAGAIYE